MKDCGIKYLIFDKDNTLTKHLGKDFYSPEIKNVINNNVRSIYSKNEIAIVSNLYPEKTAASEVFSKHIDIDILYAGKKPYNFDLIKKQIEQRNPGKFIHNHEIAFIGDKLSKDVLLAN